MKKYDKALDLVLRLLVFAYSAVLLYCSLFKLTKDKQFVVAIGIFAFICTSVYLFDGIYKNIKGHSMLRLSKMIYGEENIEHGELAPIGKVLAILGTLCLMLISMKLFGVFITVFIFMSVFPYLFDKRSIIISVLIAAVTCSAFYYLFVYMMGVSLSKGVIFGF